MATENPTGPGAAVALTIPDRHREFLRGTIDACRDGLLGDLEEGRLPDPNIGRLEVDAYSRLAALAGGEAIPVNDGMLVGLRELALTADRMNEYERVTLEHAALWGMMLKMTRSATEGRQ